MNKLAKNYIYNVLYQVFLIVVPIITAPYLTRTISSGFLGIYDYVNSVVSIITTIGLIGLQSYGYRQIAYDRDNSRVIAKSFSEIFSLRVCLLIIVSLVYLPFVLFSSQSIFFLIQYPLIVAQFLDLSWVFIGFEELGIVSLRNFLAKFITVIGIFLLVKGDADLWIYFAIFSFTTFLTSLSIVPLVRKYVRFNKPSFRSIFSHILPSIKLFIPQIATVMYLQFDKVMLKVLSNSSSQVAYYGYAEKIINIPLAIITALGTVMMPRLANLFSNNQKDKIPQYLFRTIEFAMYIAIPMLVGLSSISTSFIPWYLGEEYIATARVIIVLSPICVLNALSNILGAQYLTATNQTKILTIAYYSAAGINIALNALLIPIYGCMGAAVATVASSLLSVIIQLHSVEKEISFKGIIGKMIPKVVSSIIMGAVIIFVVFISPAQPLFTIIEVILGIVIYVVLSVLFRDQTAFYIIDRIKNIRFGRNDK